MEILDSYYPDVKCSLIYNSPLELLICARLSAQCTDVRVNLIRDNLFSKFKTLDDFASADIFELQECVKVCGLYKTKSKHIVNMCKKIIEKFNRNIPDNLVELQSLPGIGRKTANLFLAEIYNKPSIIVDTHFARVTKRLGFHDSEDALEIEFIMGKIVPENNSIKFCHQMVAHGRTVCKAIKPSCESCCLSGLCDYNISKEIN